jgi:hypothetical protein
VSWIGVGNDRGLPLELALDEERRRAEERAASRRPVVPEEDPQAARGHTGRRRGRVARLLGRARPDE